MFWQKLAVLLDKCQRRFKQYFKLTFNCINVHTGKFMAPLLTLTLYVYKYIYIYLYVYIR